MVDSGPRYTYVQWESNMTVLNRGRRMNVSYRDIHFQAAQEMDSAIERTGENIARILGLRRIEERHDISKWIYTDAMRGALTRAVDGEYNLTEHVRKLYSSGRLLGDMFSPYTCYAGVGWKEYANVQDIADKLQAVLEEHNYGMTSTRKRPGPRRVVVLDEAHSLYAPITDLQGNMYNISVLVLRADFVTDDVAAQLQRELNAGVGRV